MTARLGQLTLIITIIAVGYFIYSYVQGSVKVGKSISVADTTLETGLVGHWTFDGPDVDWSSTTAEVLDRSGSGYHGDANDSMSATSSPAGGAVGQGLDFDGTSDYVTVDDGRISNSTEGTITAWVMFDNVANTILGFGGDDVSTPGFFVFEMNGSSQLLVSQRNDGQGASDQVRGSTALNTDEWYHVVLVSNGSAYSMYLNGVEETVALVAGSNSGDWFGDTTIGAPSRTLVGALAYDGLTVNYIDGSLDDVRIYDRVLTTDEIKRLYNMGGSKIGKTNTPSGLDTGLVGHWTFDGPDMDWGSTTAEVLDISGQGNDGNAVSMSSTNSPQSGPIGQALEFDGSSNYVTIGSPAVLDFTKTDSFSLSAWIRRDTASGYHAIVETGVASGLYDGIWFDLAPSTNILRLQLVDQSFRVKRVAMTTALQLGQVYHVVATYDGSNDASGIKLYVDGQEAATTEEDNQVFLTDISGNSWNIGTNNSATPFFDGMIDDVRIYDRELSTDEIKRLYNMGGSKIGKTQSTPDLDFGLVGHWTFDGPDMDWGSTTAEVQDRSGNGNDGDATSMSAASVTPGPIGQAMEFDGVSNKITIPTISFGTSTSWSISLWAKDAPGVTAYIAGRGAGNYNVVAVQNGSNELISRSSDGTWLYSGLTVPDRSSWYQLAITYDSGTWVFYVNGTASSPQVDVSTTQFGQFPAVNSSNFEGSIDDVRIYNRALSADEILQLYNMGR